MMFDMHEIVFAEGAPSESFHPGTVGLRNLSRQARRDFETAFPALSRDLSRYGPSARTTLRSYEARLLAEDSSFIPHDHAPLRAAA